jgi:hypothetical protein
MRKPFPMREPSPTAVRVKASGTESIACFSGKTRRQFLRMAKVTFLGEILFLAAEGKPLHRITASGGTAIHRATTLTSSLWSPTTTATQESHPFAKL